MLCKVRIRNYRVFKDFTLEFSPGINIIVGNNDAGKSTLLEAINLALTARLHGYPVSTELSPHLFNQEVTQQYVRDLRARKRPPPPEIVIELYLDDAGQHPDLFIGRNNLFDEDCPGIKVKVILDEELRDGYEAYVAIPDKVAVVPTEYYTYQWLGFSGNPIKNARYLPDASLIDASTIRLQSGTDYYMQQLLDRHLDPTDRIELSRAYRSLRETFDGFDVINAKLAADQGAISRRQLSLSIDLSSRAAWERTLVPHLDHLPFQCVGKGEQSSLKIMLALNRDGDVGFPS